MPRRLVRIAVAFGIAGVFIPLLLMVLYGAVVYNAPPASQRAFRDLAVFLWPTGMALASEPGRHWTAVERGVATLVTIMENAVLYTVLGLLIGYMLQLLRPDPRRFDETAAEDELERQRSAKAKAAGSQ